MRLIHRQFQRCGTWVIFLLLAGCSDLGTAPDPVLGRVSGSWLWVRSVGGIFPHITLPEPGVQIVESYFPSGDFQRLRNGILLCSGRFTLMEEGQGTLMRFTEMKSYDGSPVIAATEAWVSVEGDTLRLMDNYPDGFERTFARVASLL